MLGGWGRRDFKGATGIYLLAGRGMITSKNNKKRLKRDEMNATAELMVLLLHLHRCVFLNVYQKIEIVFGVKLEGFRTVKATRVV